MTTLLEDQKMLQHEIHDEMKNSYIDYAMSVIVRPRPSGRARRSEAGTQKNSLRNERAGRYAGQAAQKIGAYRR